MIICTSLKKMVVSSLSFGDNEAMVSGEALTWMKYPTTTPKIIEIKI
jgi:hypothetical protein